MDNKTKYQASIKKELSHYKNQINIHELPPIHHYWANKYLKPKVMSLGYNSITEMFYDYLHKVNKIYRHINILSIGSGNCDLEINLAKYLSTNKISYCITCTDINADTLKRGKKLARIEKVNKHLKFIQIDLNEIKLTDKYEIVIASHSLHHIVNLENIFFQIKKSLSKDGYFLVNDMIGRNGHMRWQEALKYVDLFWTSIDNKYKYNHQLKRLEIKYDNWDCSTGGFEGVRSQDILKLLIKNFDFELFLGFSNITNIFVDRCFGWNYDPNSELDKQIIDIIALQDDYLISSGEIKPTQIVAVLKNDKNCQHKYVNNLSPDFCLRKIPSRFSFATLKNYLQMKLVPHA